MGVPDFQELMRPMLAQHVEVAERRRVVLIDGRRMAELIEGGVGVSRGRSFVLSGIDEDYFAGDDGSGSAGI